VLTEDEPVILRLGVTMLAQLGYTVLSANSLEEVLRLAGEHRGRIDLLITGIIMPGMT